MKPGASLEIKANSNGKDIGIFRFEFITESRKEVIHLCLDRSRVGTWGNIRSWNMVASMPVCCLHLLGNCYVLAVDVNVLREATQVD